MCVLLVGGWGTLVLQKELRLKSFSLSGFGLARYAMVTQHNHLLHPWSRLCLQERGLIMDRKDKDHGMDTVHVVGLLLVLVFGLVLILHLAYKSESFSEAKERAEYSKK